VSNDSPRPGHDERLRDDQDRPQDALDRLTVSEAADRLGVTQDAVRKRVARGTIRHDKDSDGRIFVYLDATERTSKTVQDEEQGRASKTSQDAGEDKYTRSLEDQVEFLRRELERKDTIIMSLTQRIPELEAAPETRPEPRGSSETASETPAGETSEEGTGAERQQRRSWLYRFFFGPE
jgi:excisionase family DNA binding protein